MKKFTILIAVIALVCFSVPAMANDWNFYGSARVSTNYVSNDFGNTGTTTTVTGDDTKDAQTNWLLQGNSRIGARVKGEQLSGRFEYGSGPNLRLLYGEWDFGGAKLLVGQDYTPTSQFISTSIYGNIAEDANLLGTGAFYGSREPQLKLSFGGFQIALIELADRASDLGSDGDVDVYLPKLEVGWGMGFDTWSFGLMGGAATYSIQDSPSTVTAGKTSDIDVTSYVIGAKGQVAFGPLTLKAALSAGQNVGNAWWAPGSLGAGVLKTDGEDISDTDSYQGSFVGVFKLSDMWAFEGGVGYRSDDPDDDGYIDKEMQIYLQAFITLAPGVYILPEVGIVDHFNDAAAAGSRSAGDTFYAGAKWQIDF
jgi:hypothetical protein